MIGVRVCRGGLLAGLVTVFLASGCTPRLVRNLDEFRSAKKAGDYELASMYLTDDARIWWDKKEGAGRKLTAKGGPYRDWDKEFRGKTTRGDVHAYGNTVTYLSREINDFYRLTDRVPSEAKITYYFDDDGKITGMFYRGATPNAPKTVDRYDEFKKWAGKKYPGLLDSAEMKIPKQPKRWRELLVEWRAEVGLPAID